MQGERWILNEQDEKVSVKDQDTLDKDRVAALTAAEDYLKDNPHSAVVLYIGSRNSARHTFLVARHNADTIRLVQSWQGEYSLSRWISTNHGLNGNGWQGNLLYDRAAFFEKLRVLANSSAKIDDDQYTKICQDLFVGQIDSEGVVDSCHLTNSPFLKGGVFTYPFIYDCSLTVPALTASLKDELKLNNLFFGQKNAKIVSKKTGSLLKKISQANKKSYIKRGEITKRSQQTKV